MTVVLIVILILWLSCGVYCLYHMDFSVDLQNGFFGTLCLVGITVVMLIIGPLCVREIYRVNYPKR
jgi:hypothetical protein